MATTTPDTAALEPTLGERLRALRGKTSQRLGRVGMLDMGVQDFLLTSTLNGVLAQRLVRKLCTVCREPYAAMPEMILQLGLHRYSSAAEITLFRAKGCPECHGTGYHGRTSIFETLAVADPIRRLILRRAEAHELQRLAIQQGMRTMYDDGMIKALAGITTIEEVMQVTRDVPVAHGALPAEPGAGEGWDGPTAVLTVGADVPKAVNRP